MKTFEKGQAVWVINGLNRVIECEYIGPSSQGDLISQDRQGNCRFAEADYVCGSHSEALQELAKRQLRAYAETLRELATVDPEATFSVLIGDAYLVNPTADVLAVAIRETFGETQGEDS